MAQPDAKTILFCWQPNFEVIFKAWFKIIQSLLVWRRPLFSEFILAFASCYNHPLAWRNWNDTKGVWLQRRSLQFVHEWWTNWSDLLSSHTPLFTTLFCPNNSNGYIKTFENRNVSTLLIKRNHQFRINVELELLRSSWFA